MCLMNRCNSLKHMYHFDAHIGNKKRKGEKRKRKYPVYNFLRHVQYYETFSKINKCNLSNY